MNAARAEPALGDLEAAAFPEEHVFRGHAHVLESHFRVAEGGVVVAEGGQRTHDRHARRVLRHEDLAVTLVSAFVGRV